MEKKLPQVKHPVCDCFSQISSEVLQPSFQLPPCYNYLGYSVYFCCGLYWVQFYFICCAQKLHVYEVLGIQYLLLQCIHGLIVWQCHSEHFILKPRKYYSFLSKVLAAPITCYKHKKHAKVFIDSSTDVYLSGVSKQFRINCDYFPKVSGAIPLNVCTE